MDSALWTARTGLEAQHKHLAIISNNLANANTTGFKKNRAEFEDLVYQVFKQPGAATSDQTHSPNGIVVGTGVKLADNKKMFTQGPITQTNNSLDITISGRGFLKVEVPGDSDLSYTRAGSLQVNNQGQLTMHNGYVIQPPITIPEGAQNINISKDGAVSVTTPNSTDEIGRIETADFINPSGLLAMGENLYKETNGSGQPILGTPGVDGFGTLQQGCLEGSNVNVVEEMVDLVEAQRTFEMSSKAVSAIDGILQTLIRES